MEQVLFKTTIAFNEKQSIENIFENIKRFKFDDIYYLIDSKWWIKWESFIKIPNQPRPGKIMNQELMEQDKTTLRKNLVELVDYDIVPRNAWELLLKWYGCDIEISRKVIISGFSQIPIVEIYPITLICYTSNPHPFCDHNHKFSFQKTATIKEVVSRICGHYLMPPHHSNLYPKLNSDIHLHSYIDKTKV